MTLAVGEVPHNITGENVSVHFQGGDWPDLREMMAVTGMEVGATTAAAKPPALDTSFDAILKPEMGGMG